MIRWRSNGHNYSQGKRVSRDCLLTLAERRAYVKSGPIAAVKLIRDTRDCLLREAIDLLNQARGKCRSYELT